MLIRNQSLQSPLCIVEIAFSEELFLKGASIYILLLGESAQTQLNSDM